MFRDICLVTMALCLAGVSSAFGQCFGSQTNITPTNLPQFARFGTDVAMSGNVAVSSAPQDLDHGAAYVFRFSNGAWTQQARLTAQMPGPNEYFGSAVDTDGTRVIVGSLQSADDRGRAMIYIESPAGSGNWVLEQSLPHPESVLFGAFGTAVAIHGAMAVVSDSNLAVNAVTGAGAVYVYMRVGSSWVLRQRLTTSTPVLNGNFGKSVALSPQRLVVGGPNSGFGVGSRPEAGVINVYKRIATDVILEQSFSPPDPMVDRNLGNSVDIDGDRIISGASAGGIVEDTFIYAFNGSAWQFEAALTQSNPAVFTAFGRSVSISGNFALVGESDFSQGFSTIGAARLYERTAGGWNLISTLMDVFPEPFERFGYSVVIDAGRILVGVETDNVIAREAGGVIAYTTSSLSISPGPQSQTAPLGSPVSFSVGAMGSGPLTYEWFVNDVKVSASLEPYSGHDTPTLSIGAAFGSLSSVRARVTDACGFMVDSAAASLTVSAPPASCPGDANGDSSVSFPDITSVLLNFGSACP